MIATKHRIDNARRRAAEVRRYIDEISLRITHLRRSGADPSAAELELQTMLPVVERFEAYVEAMRQGPEARNTAGD